MKKKFKHTFKDKNICNLTIDSKTFPPVITAKWKRPPNWLEIEKEYLIWRNSVVDTILSKIT